VTRGKKIPSTISVSAAPGDPGRPGLIVVLASLATVLYRRRVRD